MAVVGVGEVLIKPSFSGLQREVGKEVAGAGDSAPVKKAGGRLGTVIKNGLKVGAVAGVAALGTVLTKGFARLQSIENAKARLVGLGHDAKSVASIMKDVNASVKGTSFGLDEAASAAAGALASGIKPGQELTKYLTLVGDAATQAQVDFGSMAQMMGKVQGQGKLTGDVVAQMAENGLYVLPMLADAYGVSQAEMSKMVSQGKVDAESFQKVLTENIGGAAQESGNTLQGAFTNSMAAIGRFGANLMSEVYPQIRDFFKGFIEWMKPMEDVALVIGQQLGDALKSFTGWVRENKDAILGFIPVIATAAAGLGAYFAITKTMAAFKAIQDWYKLTTVGQKGLNAAMRANPIGVVITVITALVAAIVWLYQNNETARKIIDAAWNGIKNAVKFAWEKFIKPAFDAISRFVKNVLAPAFVWFKDNVIKPVWNWISQAISNHWRNIKVVFSAIKWFIDNVLAPVFRWLYNNVVKPVFSAIGTAIKFAWNNVIKPIFSTIKTFIDKVLGPVFRWLYDKIIKPIWNGIKTVIKNVWNNGIKPVFDTIMAVLKGDFKKAFQTAKDAIDRIWKGIANVVRKPINFVIGTVYNKGIVPMFNKVANLVGISTLDTADEIKAFAKGGYHRGGWALVGEEGPELVNFSAPGRVYTAAQTRAMLAGKEQAPEGAFDGLNAAGLLNPSHAGIGGFGDNLFNGLKSVVNTVGGAIKKGFDWVRGGLARAAEWMLKPILDGLSSNLGTSGFGGMAAGLARKAINGAIAWLKGKDSEASEDGGAMFYDGPLGSFAKPANGPITSGFGASRGRWPHAGIDFAVGIGSAVRSMLNGIVRKIGTNVVPGRTGRGMVVDHANGMSSYYGHLSAWGKRPGDEVKAGDRIASSGNTGRSTGPHLHAELWRNGIPFNYRSYLYDSGGVLNPGLSQVMNLTRQPEAILTNRQWRDISTLAQRGAQQFPDRMTLMVDGHEFTAYVSDVADNRMRSAKREARRGNRQMTGQR